eukprot:Tbor_TRINITY_DN2897_c0_g1::TRINITY_DN2897_c0_g1_i1::g.23181::m.23181
MSAIMFVLVGQCGNQLGEAIITRLFESTNYGREPSPFFTRDGKARCVLVDSEPKALEGVLQRSERRFGGISQAHKKGGIFRVDNVVTGDSGRGNNWGLGYNGLQNRVPVQEKAFKSYKNQREGDDMLLPRALQAVHRESVRAVADVGGPEQQITGLECIIVVHSLAGGTGSGFTSKLMEKLQIHFQMRTSVSQVRNKCTDLSKREKRGSKYDEPDFEEFEDEKYKRKSLLLGVVEDEEFLYWEELEDRLKEKDGLRGLYGTGQKASFITAFSVSPMRMGENAVQGINATLTLNSLLKSASAIFCLRNDDALHNFIPCPMTLASENGSHSSTRTLFKPAISMSEINNIFASFVIVMLEFGRKFFVITDILEQMRLTSISKSPVFGQERCPKILTLIPLPQRVYTKYKDAVFYSRIYRLPCDMFGAHLATGSTQGFISGGVIVPLETIHVQCQALDDGVRGRRRALPEGCSSEVNVPLPTSLVKMHQQAGLSVCTPLTLWPILLASQYAELNREIMFPLLADCYGKVKERAFMHTFEQTLVPIERIERSLKSVAIELGGLD